MEEGHCLSEDAEYEPVESISVGPKVTVSPWPAPKCLVQIVP